MNVHTPIFFQLQANIQNKDSDNGSHSAIECIGICLWSIQWAKKKTIALIAVGAKYIIMRWRQEDETYKHDFW